MKEFLLIFIFISKLNFEFLQTTHRHLNCLWQTTNICRLCRKRSKRKTIPKNVLDFDKAEFARSKILIMKLQFQFVVGYKAYHFCQLWSYSFCFHNFRMRISKKFTCPEELASQNCLKMASCSPKCIIIGFLL